MGGPVRTETPAWDYRPKPGLIPGNPEFPPPGNSPRGSDLREISAQGAEISPGGSNLGVPDFDQKTEFFEVLQEELIHLTSKVPRSWIVDMILPCMIIVLSSLIGQR